MLRMLQSFGIGLVLLGMVDTAAGQAPGKLRYDHVGIFDEMLKGDDLKMHSNTGKPFPIFHVRAGAECMRDGKKCVLADLKRGDQLRVTIEEQSGGKLKEIVRIVATAP